MELSDEQKKRILEEEQRRIAEEEYRTQVRRDLESRTVSANLVPAKSSALKYVPNRFGNCCHALRRDFSLASVASSSDQGSSDPSKAASGVRERAAEKSEKPSP